MNWTRDCRECGTEIQFADGAMPGSCPACGAVVGGAELADDAIPAKTPPKVPWRELVSFEKAAERRADELSSLNIALGIYPFETCRACEGKVLERLKCLHWGVAVSGIPELEERAKELIARAHDLDAEIAIHRREIGHKLSEPREAKSREQEFLDRLQRMIAQRERRS